MSSKKRAIIKETLVLVDQIRPLLAGKDPMVTGAALAELTATFILGHAPELRAVMLVTHYRAVIRMVKEYPDLWQEAMDAAEAETDKTKH